MTWVWIDEWFVIGCLVGVVLATITLRARERERSILLAAVGWILSLFATALIGIWFLVGFIFSFLSTALLAGPACRRIVEREVKKHGVSPARSIQSNQQVSTTEREGSLLHEDDLLNFLTNMYGFWVTSLHARILYAVSRGRLTVADIAKFVNKPESEVALAIRTLEDNRLMVLHVPPKHRQRWAEKIIEAAMHYPK